MQIKVEINDFSRLNLNHPRSAIWHQHGYLSEVTSSFNLTAHRGSELTACWIVPLSHVNYHYKAEREHRFLPYSSPLLLEVHPYYRRETFYALLEFLVKRVDSIQLPMEPGFHDIGCINELGGFSETRHTHVIDTTTFSIDGCLRHARREIRKAARYCDVRIHTSVEKFHFDKAIMGSEESIKKRSYFAMLCQQKGKILIIDAIIEGQSHGQLLLLNSDISWIGMHSWCDKSSVHGIGNLLIAEACKYLNSSGSQKLLDLEGSILYGVDKFMSGMGIPVCYPMIYWDRDTTSLFNSLKCSYLIPGRIRSVKEIEDE